MYMTDEQRATVARRLDDAGSWRCPLCGGTDISVGHVIFEMRPFAMGLIASEGPILPVIPTECPKCGYLMLFNAVTLGIVPLDEDGEIADE